MKRSNYLVLRRIVASTLILNAVLGYLLFFCANDGLDPFDPSVMKGKLIALGIVSLLNIYFVWTSRTPEGGMRYKVW
jgi:hypothetical protein